MSLIDAWLAALPPDVPAEAARQAGADLILRWSEPHRAYHTLRHLRFVLSIVDDHAAMADDPDAVRLAAWFHDAIYDPTTVGEPSNEQRSADLAAAMLPSLRIGPDRVAEVVRLVLLTAGHRVADGDRDGALLADADLAILAASDEEYRAYASAVRDEYAHVPTDAFRAGRAAVLVSILDLPTLYRLPELRDAWESQARANLTAEVDRLTRSCGDAARHPSAA